MTAPNNASDYPGPADPTTGTPAVGSRIPGTIVGTVAIPAGGNAAADQGQRPRTRVEHD